MKKPSDSGPTVRRALAYALLFLLVAVGSLHAKISEQATQRATHAFQLGNGAYEKNDYAKAADLYREALDEGVVNARLFYNYANSLFRLNQLGPAILYYEKAHK